jgi:CRP-like cAMP-binding protein
MHPLHRHIQKIISISETEFEKILTYFELAEFKKGKLIFQPGDDINYEYYVLSGCLKVFCLDNEIKTHILQFAMPDWWTTDYKAHYNAKKATMYLDCIEDSKLLCLTNENREKLCNDIPQMQFFFRIRTNRGYVALQQRILSLLSNDAKEKYEEMLAQYPDLFQKIPRTLIASYLGVTRETLSRMYNAKK